MDACSLFCVLSVAVMIIVAVVMALRASQRAPEPTPPQRDRLRYCPACDSYLPPEDRRCPECGLELSGKLVRRLERIRTTRLEIRQLHEEGELDEETALRVTGQLDARRKALLGRQAPPLREERSPVVPPPLPTRPVAAVRSKETPPPAPPPVVVPPRRSMAEAFADFMHVRNILWGELAGGLLIVGCSVALVLSLWRTLEELPYFTFLLSAGITTAVFGAGYYTLHHWKLAVTSQGLLVIAFLLTPLNLLLLGDLGARGAPGVTDILVKAGAILWFAWMIRTGGRDLVEGDSISRRWWLALALVGAPASQMAPVIADIPLLLHQPVWLALACYALPSAVVVGRLRRQSDSPSLSEASATAVLLFIGLAVFGLGAAWSFWLSRSGDLPLSLRNLALPTVIAGMPLLAAGLLLQRGTKESVGFRATGTGVAFVGLIVLSISLALAWPHPATLFFVATTVGLLLGWTAYREEIPWLYAGAVPSAAVAAALGFHGLADGWTIPEGVDAANWLRGRLTAAESGAALAGLSGVLWALSAWFDRLARIRDAGSLALGATGVAVVALSLVTGHGPEQPRLAAGVHLACAIGFIVASLRWRYRVVALFGVWLPVPATLWLLWDIAPGLFGVWGLVLAGEGLALAVTALALTRSTPLRNACRDVAGAAGLLSLALPLVAGILSVAFGPFFGSLLRDLSTSGILFLLAATAMILAVLHRERGLVWTGSLVALLAFVQLLMFPLKVESWRLAVLLGMLVHSTAGLISAILARRSVLFTEPLRFSARLTSCLAVPLLIVPDAGQAVLWAVCAAWVGVLWLAPSFIWKERGAFPAFQAALTWAAGMLGFAWVESQVWFPADTLGVFDPRSLQACGFAVALLSIGWELIRLGFGRRSLVRAWWGTVRPPADRVVLAGLVAGQLLLAAGGLLPFVVAEQTPTDSVPLIYPLAESSHVWGLGAWLLLGALAVTLCLAAVRESRERDGMPGSVAGLTVLLLTIPFLIAGSFTPEFAAASALRWGLALVFLLGSAVAAVRRPVARTGLTVILSPRSHEALRGLVAGGAVVVLLLTIQEAILGFSGQARPGPVAESVFGRMSGTVSMIFPLALLVIGLAGTAWRERSAVYACVGGWVWLGTVAGGYALGVVTAGGALDAGEQMRVVLLAIGAGAAWTLGWLAVERRIPGRLLGVMIGTAVASFAVLCLIPLTLLLTYPFRPLGLAAVRLGTDGWAVGLLLFAAAYWRTYPVWRVHVVGGFAVLAGILAACAVTPWDGLGEWLSFHVLGAAWAAAGIALAVFPTRPATRWLELLSLGLVLVGLRGAENDPWEWVPAAETAVAFGLLLAVAARSRHRAHEYAAGATAALTGWLLWIPWGPDSAAGLALSVAAGLSVAGVVLSRLRMRDGALPPFPPLSAIISVGLLLAGLIPMLRGVGFEPPLLTWGTLIAVGAVCGLLRDTQGVRFRWPGLYLVGVAAVGLALAGWRPGPVWLGWPAPVALAGYVLAVSVIVRRAEISRWVPVLQSVAALLVLGMATRTASVEAELLMRLAAPLAAALLVAAAGLLVRRAGDWETATRQAALALGIVTACLLAWAIPDPAGTVPWLHRHAGVFVALAIMSFGYLNARPAIPEHRRIGGVGGALAVIMIVVVLALQIPQYDPVVKRTPLELPTVAAVLIALLAMIALSLQCALRPDRDPLGPTTHGRAGYVYLAEVLLVLAFAHLRLNVPQVFTGQAVRYWTFIVMLLAFVGVGLAELFARRGLQVLSRPLMRTGVLLPLLPLLAFWAKPPGAVMEFADARAPGLRPMLGYLEKLPQHFDVYALLWFLAGMLYGLIALSRRSFGWALLGALATNAGLWALFSHNDIPAAVHPQVWAVPLALIVLVSEHVNRNRLRADVASGLRYLGIGMIYVASASDLFIAGVGRSLWLPVILAAWCLAGIAAGMLFRVRAFLYLGMGFMALDVFAMIWHAAVDRQQPWVWYASGIVLGAAILTLFAVLEKRRDQVRNLADRLREWD